MIPKLSKKSHIAILQIEDRNNPFFELAININKSYCNQHQIDHILHTTGPTDKPPYWWKVVGIIDLLKSNQYDIICWMDSDAYVYDTKRDIRTFFSNTKNESIIICPDPPPWKSKFMAAVFMVKNNHTSVSIFDNWLKMYNPNSWKKMSNDKWQYIGNGTWAGTDYEQGAFVEEIMPKYQPNIKILPWYVFHEINCSNPHLDCWSIHIPTPIEYTRPKCIQTMKVLTTDVNPNNKSLKISKNIIILLLLFVTIVFIIVLLLLIHAH